MHRKYGNDSAVVTFWGKRDLRKILVKAIDMLDAHSGSKAELKPIKTLFDG